MRSCEVCSPGGAAAAAAPAAPAAAGIVVGVEVPEVGGERLGTENRCRVCWGPGDGEELRSGEVAMWETGLMAGKRERRLVALWGGGGGGDGVEEVEEVERSDWGLVIRLCSYSISILVAVRVGGSTELLNFGHVSMHESSLGDNICKIKFN